MGTIKIHVRTYEGNTAWIFPMKDSELEDKLGAVGLGSSGEIPIAGVIWPEGLQMLRGLTVNADELNFLAKSIERYDESEYCRFIAAANELKSPDVAELINLSFNIEHYTLVQDAANLKQIGLDHLINIRGGIPVEEMGAIDFSAIGRKLLSSGKGIPTEYGLLFENEDVPLQAVYEGRTFPPYLYMGNEIAVINIHYQGKTEYLYLPEEDISIEKALGRLGATNLSDCTMEMEIIKCLDECWRDRLETNFELAGLYEANYLAEVLARENVDLNKLMCVTDYSDVVCGKDIRKLANHLEDFIFIKGAETSVDVGEYITLHESGYEAGEYLRDFLDYQKLGEHIAEERDGQFMYGSFVCMADGCDVMEILHEKRNEIEFGGM